MSNSLQYHGLQHTRLPCPSPTPGVYSNSCPLSQRCHPTISSSVVPLSSCLQSFPASGSFPMSQYLAIQWPKYWSFSFSVSPSNEYSGLISFRMDRLDLLVFQGTLKSLLQHHSSKASIIWHSAFFIVLKTVYFSVESDLVATWYCFIFEVNFYWSIAALQCYVNFCCTAKWISSHCSVTQLCLTLCDPMDCVASQASLSFTIS